VLVIIFRDEEDDDSLKISPDTFKSHFNHVFVAIKPEKGGQHYRVNFSSKEGVWPHKPAIPPPSGSVHKDFLRNFLLTKCINAETNAMYSLDFAPALKRTRKGLLGSIISKYAK